MARMRLKNLTLEQHIQLLIHHGKHSITELADAFGCSDSLLYRGSSLNDKTNFPANKLVPSMIKQNNFDPLRHMASLCGFFLVAIPRVRGRMTTEEIAELQADQAEAFSMLLKFFQGKANQSDTFKAIEKAMGSLARGRMAVKHGIKQKELKL